MRAKINNVIGFFVLFFSFGVMAVVYINKVIMPDENVRIITKEIHLERVDLNTRVAPMMETNRIEIANVIGFIDVIVFFVIAMIKTDIFL